MGSQFVVIERDVASLTWASFEYLHTPYAADYSLLMVCFKSTQATLTFLKECYTQDSDLTPF